MSEPAREHAVPHVVIIGAGFGGLYAARALEGERVRVTVLDRRNHHTFQPLLYQVATAALNPGDIASPTRQILWDQENATVLLADVTDIDVKRRRVVYKGGATDYDYLIVATGATHAYFGRDDWAEFAPGLKTLEDALEIRRRVLYAFEAAEREEDPVRRKAWLTFLVIGAGPTGVELAGALGEIARKTLAKDFRHIDPTSAEVLLLEGGPRVLASYATESSESAKHQLEQLGVTVRVNARVTEIDAEGVQIGDTRVPAKTVLWAAGVAGSPLAKHLGVPLDRAGRVLVDADLTIPGDDRVYVIGDLAAFEDKGKQVPGVAPAAMQEAKHAVKNLLRSMEGKPREAFHYFDKGSLATIGKGAAVAEVGAMRLSGFVAWAAWLFIHVLFLIGFRNRVIVLVEWAWFYLTQQRGARLITGSLPASLAEEWAVPGRALPPPKPTIAPEPKTKPHAAKATKKRRA